MAGIFVNYRTGSHSVAVGALAERLVRSFGAEQVFIDHQMEPGVRYPSELRARLRDSDVLVAVIHDGWTAEFERPRPGDWVRFEIATALANRQPVVPVLLERVEPPRRDELPEDIAEVAVLQAARVRGATFGADVDHLVRLLERHVVPAQDAVGEPAPVAGPRRVATRVLGWAAAFFLVALILFGSGSPAWKLFATGAFASTVAMAVLAIPTMILVPVVKRLTYRWDIEAGALSLREVFRRRWLLLVLAVLPSVFLLSEFGTRDDGVWQKWEVWFLIVSCVVGLFFMHRSWRKYEARDHKWPPPVSAEPAVFRRAGHRLHERLTTDPDWRGPRSRACQREAVELYLKLADVRLEMSRRAATPLTRWLRTGRSGEVPIYLGWFVSIVCLEVVAVVLWFVAGTGGRLLPVALTAAAALVVTAAKTMTEFLAARRDANRWGAELTEWQAKLGPLVFC